MTHRPRDRRRCRTADAWAFLVLAAVLGAGWPSTALAAGDQSKALWTPIARALGDGRHVLLSTTVTLQAPSWVYVQADGDYAPAGAGAGRASAAVEIDGVRAGNASAIDWTGSLDPRRHGFNAIGARRLGAGTHAVTLVADVRGGEVAFGAGAQLVVMTDAADHVVGHSLPADLRRMAFDTAYIDENQPLRRDAMRVLASLPVPPSPTPVVAFASATAFEDGGMGDAMMGLLANHREPPIAQQTWSIQDLATNAELRAPMHVQGLFPMPRGGAVQWVATESPYWWPRMGTTNGVAYGVEAGGQLLVLSGGMQVVGGALTPVFPYRLSGLHRRYAYVCIGSSGFRARCPAQGSEVMLASGRVCVPPGHNGVVLFNARSRVQGDSRDGGGIVRLGIRIGGRDVGYRGVQDLGPASHAESTRTIAASYLSAGADALAPGCHEVQAIASATGDFRNLSMNADLPLLWFD